MTIKERRKHVDIIVERIRESYKLGSLTDVELRCIIAETVDNYLDFEGEDIPLEDEMKLKRGIFSQFRGLGILDEIVDDESITEIMINGMKNVFVEKGGRLIETEYRFKNEAELSNIIQNIVGKVNRTINEATPIVDARLENGSRVNAVWRPISLCGGPVLTIRKFSRTPMTMEWLIEHGSLTRDVAYKLKQMVKAKFNIFISGGTGSGKTTFLNALSNYIPKDERIITIEDSAELNVSGVPNLVSLETRDSNGDKEHDNSIPMRMLIKSSLRMRPDRIIVGEVRGVEAIDMLQAMNTGHDGSLSTGHANSAKDMLSRLEMMIIQGSDNIPIIAIRNQISSAIDVIVHLSRFRDKSRRVEEIVEIGETDEKGNVILNPLYKFIEDENRTATRVSGELIRTANPMLPKHQDKLERAGIFDKM